MKRIPLFLAFLFLLLAGNSRADLIPKDMKPIYVAAILENMRDFPDYVFAQLETLGGEIRASKVIRPGQGIQKHYKLNALAILAIPKPLFDKAGGLEGLKLLSDPSILRTEPKARIESGQQLVSQLSSVAGKEIFYRIKLVNAKIELIKTGEKEFYEHPNFPPINLMLWGFLVTFALELILFVLLVRVVFRSRTPGALRAIVVVLAAQTATLPLLWLIIHHYNLMGTSLIFVGECCAVAVEAAIYKFFARLTWKHAAIVSLICNAASYGLGLLL